MIKVIHIRDADLSQPNQIYVGRAGCGLQASPLANPFRLHHESQRDEVIAHYRQWLFQQLQVSPQVLNEIRRLGALEQQYGQLSLVCYCAPRHCHGDVIQRCIQCGLYTR